MDKIWKPIFKSITDRHVDPKSPFGKNMQEVKDQLEAEVALGLRKGKQGKLGAKHNSAKQAHALVHNVPENETTAQRNARLKKISRSALASNELGRVLAEQRASASATGSTTNLQPHAQANTLFFNLDNTQTFHHNQARQTSHTQRDQGRTRTYTSWSRLPLPRAHIPSFVRLFVSPLPSLLRLRFYSVSVSGRRSCWSAMACCTRKPRSGESDECF
jgi:hypothetical protein